MWMIVYSDWIDYEVLGKNIKGARERLNMTQTMVAEELGVSYTYFGKIERGVVRPNLERLISLCFTLHVPISDIFRGVIKSDKALENISPSNDSYVSQFQILLDRCNKDETKQAMIRLCNELEQLEKTR